MSELKNDLFLRACLRQDVERTPVWMMRQAGRYLPEYRATRARAGGFLNLCRSPEMCSEVTLQPIDILDADAAILFSDILVVPEAMGMELTFGTGEGPKFPDPIACKADVEKLPVLDDPTRELGYVMDAVSTIRRDLNGRVPLIGFAGSPWTLATYMVEGGGSKNFSKVKAMMFNEPETMHLLLEKLADSVAAYLNGQIAAGAQAVQIFDTWGGILNTRDYKDFSLQYMQRIVSQLTREHDGRKVPVILYSKGGMGWLEAMADTGCDVLGLDWSIDIDEARRRVGDKVALQGNMDPTMLYANPEKIRAEVKDILAKFGHGNGHVFNLGHGITPDVPPEHAIEFFKAVREESVKYHAK
ncbi:uroporphyrinogen decarboxylase [Ghiorsea bivora]|uniref:uroporphyrinogen decarboxylase n=1 Tax=Ghiorsea bivora TaxID=1485545 RepID=UPI0005706642|nr:uroporphyrinogen decarboxylase [Ghiorsea bivora]